MLGYLMAALTVFLLLSGCTQLSKEAGKIDLRNPSGVNLPSPTPSPSVNSGPLRGSLKIGTIWENADSACNFSAQAVLDGSSSTGANLSDACDTVTQVHQTCSVPTGTAPGTNVACSVSIPEGQLFYSSVRFQFTESSKECARVSFMPYYYRASDQPGFNPAWGSSAVDCSVPYDTLSADCFNGPAKSIAPQFPKYTGLYSVFGKQSGTWEHKIPVANSISPGLSNRWAANNLNDAKRDCNDPAAGLPSGDGYVCNSMRDYRFICFDEYDLVRYSITVRIFDVDDGGLAATLGLDPNQRESWSEYNQ